MNSSIACKACVSAGKTGDIMHLLKNLQGVVVCPMLLNQDCEWCVQNGYRGSSVKGHTPKYCERKKASDAIQDKNRKLYEKEQRTLEFAKAQKEKETKVEKSKKPVSANVFDALNWSSDEETTKKKKSKKSKKEKFAAPIPETVAAPVPLPPPPVQITNYLDAVKSMPAAVKPKKMTAIPLKKTKEVVAPEPRIAGEKSAPKEEEIFEDKDDVGEKLYYKLLPITEEKTGKVVGMILHANTVAELEKLYQNEDKLMLQVKESLRLIAAENV